MKKIITFENQVYEITDEQADKIMEISTLGKQNGIWLNGNYISFPSIKEITEGTADYHQPYKELPAVSFDGIIRYAPVNGLQAMIRGIKKAIIEMKTKGQTTKNAEQLLAKMEARL